MIVARQSTARTVIVGPWIDSDGVPVTDGVVGDLKISKNGAAPAGLNGSATLTHRHTGFYSLALTASDLDTVGQAEVTIDDGTNTMPLKEITVVEEAVYDSWYASGATGPLVANERGGRVLYVTKAGNNSNSGLSFTSAKLTIAGAVAIARNGDTIWIGDGTYSEQVDLATATLSNITLVGQSRSGTIVTATVTGFFGVIMGYDGTWVENMTVSTATDNGTAITFLDNSNCGLRNVTANGVWDSVFNGYLTKTPRFFRAYNSRLYSKGDVLNLAGNKEFLLDRCELVTDSTGISVPVVGTEPTNCIIAPSGATGTVRNSTLTLTRGSAYNGTSHKSAGICAGGSGSHIRLEGSLISVTASGATDAGDIRGIASHPSSPEALHATIIDSEIVTARHASSSQNLYDVDASTSGSRVRIDNSLYTASKLNGTSNITTDLTPTTAARTLDVTAGGEVEVTLTGENIEDIAHAVAEEVSAGLAAIDPTFVDEDHTWRFDDRSQITSPQLVTESATPAVLVQMDFTEPMPAEASIASITSVSVEDVSGATEPTVVSSAVNGTRKKVVITMNTASATAGTYVVTVVVVTVDGQTFTRKGRMVVE